MLQAMIIAAQEKHIFPK